MVIYPYLVYMPKCKYIIVEKYKMLNLLLNQTMTIYVDQIMYAYLAEIYGNICLMETQYKCHSQ